MKRFRLAFLMVTCAVLFLAVAWPAVAQDRPVQPKPGEPKPEPERCMQAGLGLAVLSQDGAIADILAMNASTTRPGSSPTRGITVVIEAPAMVGACADFQGFWGSGASGQATARLALYDAPLANASTPIASEGLEQTMTGPAMLTRRLKAMTRVEQPGTYHYVATYRVEVTPNGGQAVSEEVRVPFAVVFYVKPKPGAIAGTVYGADGNPLAGARVSANPNQALNPKPPKVGLPVQRPILLGRGSEPLGGAIGDPLGDDRGGTVTGPDGTYRLEVGPGQYFVTAQARGHKPQWYNGKDNQREADPVEVVSEQTVAGIDFHLVAGEGEAPKPTPAPPKDKGVITGHVSDANGAPLKGMLVIGAPPPATTPLGILPRGVFPSDDDRPGRPSTKTNEQGVYELAVPVGKWTVQASGEGYLAQWYNGQGEQKDATVLDVAKDGRVENIDFSLSKMPQAIVSGHVTNSDGSAARGAMVKAMKRSADGQPAETRVPAGYRTSTTTKEDGTYALLLPPGEWVFVAKAPAVSVGTPPAMIWWDQKATIQDADLLDLADGANRDDINFQFQ